MIISPSRISKNVYCIRDITNDYINILEIIKDKHFLIDRILYN